MNRKLFFEDGSSIEISLNISDEGKMATVAIQKLTEFLDDDLMDDPRLALQDETAEADREEEELDDLYDIDEEWVDEEEFDEDWEEEEEEDFEEMWEEDEDEYVR